MNEDEVTQTLHELDGRWATPERVRWLTNLSTIYESQGVLTDGFAPALQERCPSAPECWARAAQRHQAVIPANCGSGQNASIFWPWVGENYRRGGVCLVTLNLNHAEGGWWAAPTEEYAIAGHVLNGWAQGKKSIWFKSPFHWRATASALAVLDSLAGNEPIETPTLTQVSDAFERIARVQAVKCVPRHRKSYPEPAMRRRCPSRFAVPELELLAPSVIVALGRDAEAAIALLGKVTWSQHAAGQFGRGSVDLPSGRALVCKLAHPSARGGKWSVAQAELIASLRAEPLQNRLR